MNTSSQTVPFLDIESYYNQLYVDCGQVLNQTLKPEYRELQSQSHNFIADYSRWIHALNSRPEHILYKRAINEYQFALLALVLGHYRQAFTALRLFQELSLAGVYFSSNELLLREWLRGNQDIKWGTLRDPDNGIFSKRFARAFFEDLQEISPQYGLIAEKVYRECSEYTHGNAYTHNLLPGRLEFAADVFIDWHSKATSIRLIASFALCIRYLKALDKSMKDSLEGIILDELGYIPEIRSQFESDSEGK